MFGFGKSAAQKGAWVAKETLESSEKPVRKRSFLNIPTKIFKDRRLAVLESIVVFLKEEKQQSFHEIAELLNRDDRTVWTVYHRVQKKRKKWSAETSSERSPS